MATDVPDGYVLVLDQASHMDWDWTLTHAAYLAPVTPGRGYERYGVLQILDAALSQLQDDTSGRSRYSLCEVGFLRSYAEARAGGGVDVMAAIRGFGRRFTVVGGGVTSPDCLVVSGEAFLRNYLCGAEWLREQLPGALPLRTCWIPDDFGQDPELPVLLTAAGMDAVAFSRIPGTAPGTDPDATLRDELMSAGADFLWRAGDGCTVFAHWMVGEVPGYYVPGVKLQNAVDGVAAAPDPTTPEGVIATFLTENDRASSPTPPYSAAPSRFVYMPLDADFMTPVEGLLAVVDAWNASSANPGVTAVLAGFPDFVELVRASGAPLATRHYDGRAYWTGFYASRPALKILHQQGAEALGSAEVAGLLAHGLGAADDPEAPADPEAGAHWERVRAGWEALAPSTHHDFVTGTSPDDVLQAEQLPLLGQAVEAGRGALERAGQQLGVRRGSTGRLLCLNTGGAPFAGLVEAPLEAPAPARSVRVGGHLVPLQRSDTGGVVFPAEVPSMAALEATLSPEQVDADDTVSVEELAGPPGTMRLTNRHLTAVLDATGGIASLRAAGHEVLGAAGGNRLVLYPDTGGIYQFAFENPGGAFTPDPTTLGTVSAAILESGPHRAAVTYTLPLTLPPLGTAATYVVTYRLCAGARRLDVTVRGAAPSGYSVLTSFAFARPVAAMTHGTPAHWTAATPRTTWTGPTFRPVQRYLVCHDDAGPLAAVLTPEMPAWATWEGSLLGCLLRNTPALNGRGTWGTDDGTHEQRFALRVPAELPEPRSGGLDRESLAFAQPATARLVGAAPVLEATTPATADLPPVSVASVEPPGLVRAVKPHWRDPSRLVVRLYQPTGSAAALEVTLGLGRPSAVHAVTALEDRPDPRGIRVSPTDHGFRVQNAPTLSTYVVDLATGTAPAAPTSRPGQHGEHPMAVP
jgi:alpha-mannosidase